MHFEVYQIIRRFNIMIRTTLFLSLILLGHSVLAQNNTVNAGETASGPGGTATYSVGQMFYQTFSTNGGTQFLGVQQSFEIYFLGDSTELIPEIKLVAYPNPTQNILTISSENYTFSNGQYQVFDFSGKLIQSNTINSSQTQIDMTALPSATYFIRITNNNQNIQTFKIIKN